MAGLISLKCYFANMHDGFKLCNIQINKAASHSRSLHQFVGICTVTLVWAVAAGGKGGSTRGSGGRGGDEKELSQREVVKTGEPNRRVI